MATQFATSTRNAAGNGMVSDIGSNAVVVIYSGTKPANVAAGLGGASALVTLPCSATFAPSASGGVLTVNPITTTNATATGNASFYRVLTSGGVAKIQGDVTNNAAAADDPLDPGIELSRLDITLGDPISINSLTYTIQGA